MQRRLCIRTIAMRKSDSAPELLPEILKKASALSTKTPSMNLSTALSRETLLAVNEQSPYSKFLGTVLEKFEHGEVEIRLVVRQEFRQHHGYVHGSLVGYMADTACAWVAASVAGDVVTSEYKINLLAPAIGDELRARGTVVKAGARQVVARADVFALKDGRETVIATALSTVARVTTKQ